MTGSSEDRGGDTESPGIVTGLPASYARWRQSRLGQITDAIEAELIFDLLGPIDGARVLDVGCGDGARASELSRRGADVTGLDPDPNMVMAARKKAGAESGRLRFVEGTAERLPFGDATFDSVAAVTVLCFVEDAERAVAEMARVLKPGGRLVIGELGRWSFWAALRRVRGWLCSRTWQAARFRTAAGLRALTVGAGLETVDTRGGVFYPPFAPLAQMLAPVDRRLGRRTAFGAAFIALSAKKPSRRS